MSSNWMRFGLILAVGVVLFAAAVVWQLPNRGVMADTTSVAESAVSEAIDSPAILGMADDEIPDADSDSIASENPEAVIEKIADEPTDQERRPDPPPEPEEELMPGSDSRLDAMVQSEPVDPTWAPRMEGAIETVIAAAGLTAYTESDWDLQCRTSVCRAHVTHLEGYDRDAFDLLVNEQLGPMMRSVVAGEIPRVTAFKLGTRHSTRITPLPGDRTQTTLYIFESGSMPLPGPP